ncbi:hypothetical protein CBS101457_004870 [Exobasidium rhododendri]|nr:hypothetical protein CBS101457_004870 [Exobasidium rhododendri]
MPSGPTSQTCRRCVTKHTPCVKDESKRLYTSKAKRTRSDSAELVQGHRAWNHIGKQSSSHYHDEDSIGSGSGGGTTSSRNHHIPSASLEPGFPSLSNPYKLLAQASGGNEQRSIFSTHGLSAENGEQSSRQAKAVASSDVIRWRASFSAGKYAPRYEGNAENDPVNCGILSASRAAALFHTYVDQYNDGNVLLDPTCHTFEYVSMHSFLASALYLVVAKQEVFEGSEEISEQLEDHLKNKLLPLIVFKGYRSVEIVIGMLALATFYFSTEYIYEDQSWSLLGQAIKIGTELDLNSRIVSRALVDSDEKTVRMYRSQERTWMNLYLTAQSFSLQTGRRHFLSPEGVVEDCENWHLDRFAMKIDVAIVASLQIRALSHTHRNLFNRLCSSSVMKRRGGGSDSGLSDRDLPYYLKRVEDDLSMWYDRFKDADPTSIPASRLQLSLHHTKVILFSMPLQNTVGDIKAAKPAIALLYEATVAYLEELTGANPLHRLGRGHNSIFLNGCYVAVMALKLTTLANRLPWIDVDYLFRLVKKTAQLFCKEGRGPKYHKDSFEAYAGYLYWLLYRYQDQSSSSSISKQTDKPDKPDHASSPSFSTWQPSHPNLTGIEAERFPLFVLPDNLGNTDQLNGMTELWGDHVAFSDDNNFTSWAQRFLGGEDASLP